MNTLPAERVPADERLRAACLRILEFAGELPQDLMERLAAELEAFELVKSDTFRAFVTERCLPQDKSRPFEGPRSTWTKKAPSKAGKTGGTTRYKTTVEEATELSKRAQRNACKAVEQAVVIEVAIATSRPNPLNIALVLALLAKQTLIVYTALDLSSVVSD